MTGKLSPPAAGQPAGEAAPATEAPRLAGTEEEQGRQSGLWGRPALPPAGQLRCPPPGGAVRTPAEQLRCPPPGGAARAPPGAPHQRRPRELPISS